MELNFSPMDLIKEIHHKVEEIVFDNNKNPEVAQKQIETLYKGSMHVLNIMRPMDEILKIMNKTTEYTEPVDTVSVAPKKQTYLKFMKKNDFSEAILGNTPFAFDDCFDKNGWVIQRKLVSNFLYRIIARYKNGIRFDELRKELNKTASFYFFQNPVLYDVIDRFMNSTGKFIEVIDTAKREPGEHRRSIIKLAV